MFLKSCNQVTKWPFWLQKVTNSGDDARKWAKSYKKLQESYRIIFDNFLIQLWLQKLQRLQGFFKIS